MKKLLVSIILLCALTLTACSSPAVPAADKPQSSTESAAGPVEAAVTEELPGTSPAVAPEAETVPELDLPDVNPTVDRLGRDRLLVADWFCRAALGPDGTESENLLHRWNSSVLYASLGPAEESDLDTLSLLPELFGSVNGLPVLQEASDTKTAALLFVFCDRAQFMEEIGEEVDYEECDSAVRLHLEADGSISSAEVYIRSDCYPYLRSQLIQKEALRALGLIYEVPDLSGSILSPESGLTAPGETDLLLLQILYCGDLSCGMNAYDCQRYAAAVLK